MAGIGLSDPKYAKYTFENGEIVYKEGGRIGKFTELTISLNEGSTNSLYADNAPTESDNRFTGGTAALGTDDLHAGALTPVFGAKKENMNGDVVTADACWYVWDDDQTAPFLGIGGVLKKQVNGDIKYVAYVLIKVQFRNPGIVATTQGETISWQTQSLTANIYRGDDAKHRWFMISSLLDSLEDANKAVDAYLNIK